MAKKVNPGSALVALRWAKTSKEERSEAASKAAKARWAKKKRKAA